MRPAAVAIALLGAAAFGAIAALQPARDPDLFWHLATGRQTLESGLARTDVFSWTIPGRAVFVDQWLGDVVIAASWTLGGWQGVAALRGLVATALAFVVFVTALAARPERPLIGVCAALPALFLARFVTTDRPAFLALVCFAVLVALLRARDARWLFATVPLLLLWANLHGSFALGLGLVVLIAVARAINERERRTVLIAAALAATAITLMTPSGLTTWTGSGGHFFSPPRFISEEGVPDPRSPIGTLFAVTLSLLLATALLGRGAGARAIAILVPVTFVSLTATRHLPFLAIAAAPYFASWWPDPLRATPSGRGGSDRRLVGACAAIAAGVLGAAILFAPNAPDESDYPVAALAALEAGPGLFNAYEWGGWLIWRAPASPVFIDGRLFPYQPDVLADYSIVSEARPGWREVVARRNIRALLVRPSDPIAVRAEELGWRATARDDRFVLLRRP